MVEIFYFKRYLAEILSADNHRMLYVPEGFAHGFLTAEDNCQVYYQVSEFYAPERAKGIRWNDAVFESVWPLDPAGASPGNGVRKTLGIIETYFNRDTQ